MIVETNYADEEYVWDEGLSGYARRQKKGEMGSDADYSCASCHETVPDEIVEDITENMTVRDEIADGTDPEE